MNDFEKTERPAKPSLPPIPWWAWLFALGCAIIPVFTLGGAIPGALGFGGAGGCIAASRNLNMPSLVRAAICLAIVVMCWSFTYAIAGGLALLRR
jgi:hypothetical protein